MLSRIFKKQTFGIVNSLCKNNLLSFQSLSVKYFGNIINIQMTYKFLLKPAYI